MSEPVEVTVVAPGQWASRSDQLAALLGSDSSAARVIPDPTGRPADPEKLAVIVGAADWAADQTSLREALGYAGGHIDKSAAQHNASGAVSPVEARLVYTVEEAATLLGISRSFAYEAVARGDVPSMRIGKRILVPKAALQRWLAETPGARESRQADRRAETYEEPWSR